MQPQQIIYLVPVVAVLALIYAFVRASWVQRQDPGNERMQLIGSWIAQGAMAFLKREYRFLLWFVISVAILLGVLNYFVSEDTSAVIALSFVLGAFCSALSGYFGMRTATRANTRTASAARKGLNDALMVAFTGGSVMGLSVVGLALLGLGGLFIVYMQLNPDAMTSEKAMNLVLNNLSGFSLGASSIALFARVGGGIYTKAADVGADLVGKVESGIPEDHPLNPATIADNVGDNVGDVAGMGADLFESYVGAIVSAMILGVVWFGGSHGARTGRGAQRGAAAPGCLADRHRRLDHRLLLRAHQGGRQPPGRPQPRHLRRRHHDGDRHDLRNPLADPGRRDRRSGHHQRPDGDVPVVGHHAGGRRRPDLRHRRRLDHRVLHGNVQEAGADDRRGLQDRSGDHDHPGHRGGHELHDAAGADHRRRHPGRLRVRRPLRHRAGRGRDAVDAGDPARHRRLRPDRRQRRRRRRDVAPRPRHPCAHRQARRGRQHHRGDRQGVRDRVGRPHRAGPDRGLHHQDAGQDRHGRRQPVRARRPADRLHAAVPVLGHGHGGGRHRPPRT